MHRVRWTQTLEGECHALPSAGKIVAGDVAELPDGEAERAIAAGLAESATDGGTRQASSSARAARVKEQ